MDNLIVRTATVASRLLPLRRYQPARSYYMSQSYVRYVCIQLVLWRDLGSMPWQERIVCYIRIMQRRMPGLTIPP